MKPFCGKKNQMIRKGERIHEVIGDKCCNLNETGLLQALGFIDCDFVYANFTNTVLEQPYAIIADHSKRCIIITIRGI